MPRGPGHTLDLPKGRARNRLDIGAHELQRLMIAVQRVARALKSFGGTILQNGGGHVGEAEGSVVLTPVAP